MHAVFNKRRESVAQKSKKSASKPKKRTAQTGARSGYNHEATVEEFEREGMGVAPKE